MGFEIRSARIGDAAEITRLCQQLGYGVDRGSLQATLAKVSESEGQFVAVAPLSTGGLGGWIQVEERCCLESGGQGEIAGLVVDQAARRLGIGRALVEAGEAWARDRGLPRLTVRTQTFREDALAFYADVGFQEEKRQVVWRKAVGGA